jgi:hypothetical protein
MDCQICCETFNKQNHKKVECPFCDFIACRSCIQQYLLTSSNDAHCMGCKHTWNREFVDLSCTKIFRNKEYKLHRENILLQREKCLLPESQIHVARRREAREVQKLLEAAESELDRQRHYCEDLRTRVVNLRNGYAPNDEAGPSEKKQFVRKCPVDDCKGFLTTRWKCEVCDNNICSKCNEIKKNDGGGEEQHECNPDSVKTVELLKKDTKPCPKCGTLHFKISGCNQMWCPSCHVAYNWNTGKIELGVIHNPHFYEFQQRGGAVGRNHGDIPCGGMPTVYEMNDAFGRQPYTYNRFTQPRSADPHVLIHDIHRQLSHITNYELRYNFMENNPNNLDLRVKFLMNELSEVDFKKIIQQREKKYEKMRDMRNILTMITDTGGDLMRQLVQETAQLTRGGDAAKDRIQEKLTIFEELREYTNTVFHTIYKRYTNRTLYIDKRWSLNSYNGAVPV